MTRPPEPGQIVTAAMLDAVPRVVRRYLEWSGVEGQPVPTTLALRQTGRLRAAQDKRWMTFSAEEDFTTDPPTFSWRARVRVAGLPLVRAWDSYVCGRGRMQVRFARAVTLADLHGDVMDSASLLRYLNETAWFPAAYLLEGVRWEAINERSAQVSITDHGQSATGTMSFGRDGRPLAFSGLRHRHLGGGRFSLDRWVTPFAGYGVVNGARIPTSGWAEYRLDSGTLRYIELAVRPRSRRPGPNASAQQGTGDATLDVPRQGRSS